jgi:uncharacterized protein (DUF2141 family)
MIAALFAMVALQATPMPQAPAARDARGPVKGAGVLAGIVVSDDADAKPVRRVRVTCTTTDVQQGVTTITDDAGRFACSGLATGRFTVSASRDAWVTTPYGAKRPMRPGTAVPVTSGEKTEIVLRMPRGGVITGTVLDHSGQPASNAGVRAMRYAISLGERRLQPYGSASTTDDRGVYRIYGLAAGDYIVGASGRAGFFGTQSSELRLMPDVDIRQAPAPGQPPPRERGVAFASTYYPGTTTSSQAGVVTVRAGEERSGVDFALLLVTTARVDGAVSLPEGGTPPDTQITLLASGQTTFPGMPFDGFRTGRVGPGGEFSFSDISPGQYTLLARGTRTNSQEGGTPGTPPQMMWAAAEVSVDGENVSSLALALEPGMTIAGQIHFESAAQKPTADMKSIRVSLQPVQAPGATISPSAATPDASGQFRLSGVTPGRYRLFASAPGAGRPGGWIVKSAVISGQDTLDAPFVLQPNQNVADAVITFTDRLAQLTGSVLNAAGVAATDFTVVIFPTDQALWMPQSRRIQGVRPAADGAYTFRNLPPGDYYVAAIDDVEPGEWFDPAFLQRLLPTAMKVAIADGEQKAQDIRSGGG